MREMEFLSVISLKSEIKHHLESCDNSLARDILEFGYKKVESFEEIAKRVVWIETISFALAEAIKQAVSKLKGLLHSDVLEQIDSQSAIRLKQDTSSSFEMIFKKIKDEYDEEVYYPLPEEEEEKEDVVSSRIGSARQQTEMIGLSDVYRNLKHKLMAHKPTTVKVVSVFGMPGIGKTTLANGIFEDADIVKHFNCRVWVTVGRKCQLKEIPLRILAEMNPSDNQMLAEGDEDTAYKYLKESLKDKRYLIVLDDVWDEYMAYHLQPSNNYLLPSNQNGSRVLLTTRREQVYGRHCRFDFNFKIRLLKKEESWDLLRAKVFAEGCCPSQLERAGKKIAENCDGLPLTIVTVADLLSKKEKTPLYWSQVAEQKNHLFKAAFDEISKVLFSSYEHLPPILQMCFLYMGVFPPNYEIPRTKLINMWNIDGFLELNRTFSRYAPGLSFLKELIFNSLVMTHQTTIGPWPIFVEVKSCGLHSSLWHLCNREAAKIKFFHVLNSRNDGLGEGIKKQRRLSFHNNILFGVKDVHKSVEDNCSSSAHSLLFYGPYHQYQVPICFSLMLLKKLDALTIRFYEFPMEVLQLVELRYLALTLNGKLPASISQLSNLNFLIINRHLSIKSCRDPSYLPVEMWDMQELRYLQVMGSDLPDPPRGAFIENLIGLSNVSSHSCTEGILKAVPRLVKLGIQIELTPDDDGKHLSCFDHIFHLNRLSSFKCVVMNPEVVRSLAPLSVFPLYLSKLSLSGLGYPWKEVSKIASLKHLLMLKLRNYAFRGPIWETEEKGFPSLRYLMIEDTDLVEWNIEHKSFCLSYLNIKQCYRLEKIHGKFDEFCKIDLVDCNRLGVEQIKRATQTSYKLSVHSSWDDRSSRP